MYANASNAQSTTNLNVLMNNLYLQEAKTKQHPDKNKKRMIVPCEFTKRCGHSCSIIPPAPKNRRSSLQSTRNFATKLLGKRAKKSKKQTPARRQSTYPSRNNFLRKKLNIESGLTTVKDIFTFGGWTRLGNCSNELLICSIKLLKKDLALTKKCKHCYSSCRLCIVF